VKSVGNIFCVIGRKSDMAKNKYIWRLFGEDLPPEFSRPEVAKILMGYYQSLPKED